jgi:hypothetical protein
VRGPLLEPLQVSLAARLLTLLNGSSVIAVLFGHHFLYLCTQAINLLINLTQPIAFRHDLSHLRLQVLEVVSHRVSILSSMD